MLDAYAGFLDSLKRHSVSYAVFIVAQNHSLGEWFKKAYGDEQEEKTPFAIMEVRSVSCTKNSKGRSFRWD